MVVLSSMQGSALEMPPLKLDFNKCLLIQNYESLVRGMIFEPKYSSIATMDAETFVGDSSVNLRIYYAMTLLLSCTTKRILNDGILALSLSGNTGCGKSKLLDCLLSQVSRKITFDAGGVGRYLCESEVSCTLHVLLNSK